MSLGPRESKRSETRTLPIPSGTLRVLYRQAAETVLEEGAQIDSIWLINKQFKLWAEMRNLDVVLSRLERGDDTEASYVKLLTRLIALVKETRRLYEQDRRRGSEEIRQETCWEGT
ncbi:MAG: hypothetical protein AB7P18_28475 [Candidatus Binatia bacterium]